MLLRFWEIFSECNKLPLQKHDLKRSEPVFSRRILCAPGRVAGWIKETIYMRFPTDHPKAEPVNERIIEVGRALAHAFTGVLDAIPGGPHRPKFLARSLGVNTVLTSRILKAAQ